MLGGTPDFFHQNDRKGCKRDYLDARGHIVSRFGAIGDKPFGGVLTTHLGRRGLTLLQTPHFLPILLLKGDLWQIWGCVAPPAPPQPRACIFSKQMLF